VFFLDAHCQVTFVVMETAQLVLSQFKIIYCSQFRIEQNLSTPKISKCCELVKLCHSNSSGLVFLDFLRHTVYSNCSIQVDTWYITCMFCITSNTQILWRKRVFMRLQLNIGFWCCQANKTHPTSAEYCTAPKSYTNNVTFVRCGQSRPIERSVPVDATEGCQ